MNELLITILVKKIQAEDINPITGQVYKLDDIKRADYKTEVGKRLEAV